MFYKNVKKDFCTIEKRKEWDDKHTKKKMSVMKWIKSTKQEKIGR